MTAAAWYSGTRREFLETSPETIANQLAGKAAAESLDIDAAQANEWNTSIALLQESIDERIPIIRHALIQPECEDIENVILEFDFRRRGLRIDCLLLAKGALFVIEFKRSRLLQADRDQVMGYAVNLLEFHRVTSEWSSRERALVIPILALTNGRARTSPSWPGQSGHSWSTLANSPLECDKASLKDAIAIGLSYRSCKSEVRAESWIASPFSPSSSILDAALSLYGNHDVAAIQGHSAPKAAIAASVQEIQMHVANALANMQHHIVFLSGAPGAGKTLVGLEIVMRGPHARHSVFVTGNAPLVEVLNKALGTSYKSQGRNAKAWTATGYKRRDAALVATAATFKIVKAHHFLGNRGQDHRQEDSQVLVFDEAQRTYEKGRQVLGQALADHEADLILTVQRSAFPNSGAVVVALVGHNQAINRGERGIVAWLEAADRLGWTFSIADDTLALAEIEDREYWANHAGRRILTHGHLRQSMRYYRNSVVEEWAAALLLGKAALATKLADTMNQEGNTIFVTRDLNDARSWARANAFGGQRCGIIASGQARRLAAEGLFVDLKPDIATWMLAPSTDIRSSNALETVQNQYQVQGLELDYCIVCWDADLRWEGQSWRAYKLSGDDWKRDGLIDVALNGYRVLLTRARKGMIIFVPTGDSTDSDLTRRVAFYDGIYQYLLSCGAVCWNP
ncbi:MAG: DUF2075 domain-containing protein [Betaproteobacteria bacterium]|nr:DUF2075 domain-containing protein [Betaproteobacteria bacterium]